MYRSLNNICTSPVFSLRSGVRSCFNKHTSNYNNRVVTFIARATNFSFYAGVSTVRIFLSPLFLVDNIGRSLIIGLGKLFSFNTDEIGEAKHLLRRSVKNLMKSVLVAGVLTGFLSVYIPLALSVSTEAYDTFFKPLLPNFKPLLSKMLDKINEK